MGNTVIDFSVHPSEEWYNVRLGLDFSERVITDPVRRTEMMREARRGLYDIFGDVRMGEADPVPAPQAAEVFGHRFMSALLGADIVYHKNQAPAAIARPDAETAMRDLKVPDFEHTDAFKKALEDYKTLRRRYGRCGAGVNMGSPLNVAVSVFGEDFLMACFEEPEVAQHVLRVIAELEYRLYHAFENRLEPDVYPSKPVDMQFGNCPAIMLSPEMYRDVVLPVDKAFRARARNLYLHHCGVFDEYTELYTELNPTTVEIGGGSDYARVCAAFPMRRFSMIVNTGDAEKRSPAELKAFVRKMISDSGCANRITNMYCTDISSSMPDDKVRALRTSTWDMEEAR